MRHPMMVIIACLVAIFASVSADVASEPILIVIGDVTLDSARILYDALNRKLVGTEVEARLYDDNDRLVTKAMLLVSEAPRIWKTSNLTPGKQYRIEFHTDQADPVVGRFRTDSNLHENVRILASSCNNLLEDHDDSFISELAENALVQGRFGMIHLGDQLYADFIYQNWVKNGRLSSHNDLVNDFRNAYRTIWANKPMRTLLRTGANWMVIDDHDILNNLDPDQLKDGREPLLRAGRQAYLEYQLQLLVDVFDDDGQELGSPHAYHLKTVGSLALVFSDTRFERTFNFDPDAPFLGTKQMEFLSHSLQKLDQDPKISNVVLISSVPLAWAPSPWVSRLPEIFEKEKMALHPIHRQESIKLLNIASQYASKLSLLSGDIHLFLHSKICSRSRPDAPCLDQITASGLTVGSTSSSSFKVLAFHFLALCVGSNIADDLIIHVNQVNVGRNAVILESSSRDIQWIPVFPQNACLWTRFAQFAFTQANFISKWWILFACIPLSFLCTVIYRRRGNTKAKSN